MARRNESFKVHVLAWTSLVSGGVVDWLQGLGCPAPVITGLLQDRYRDQGATLAMLAGKRCYKSFSPEMNANVTKVTEGTPAYIANLLRQGHGSVLEHASVTFAFEGVSRVFTHELVRHRHGAYSQESQRYVALDNVPLAGTGDTYLPSLPRQEKEVLNDTMREIEDEYADFQRRMTEKMEAALNRDALTMPEKKALTSRFRRVLGNGVSTGIVATYNIRALRNVLEQRTSVHAEVEMRQVFMQVFELVWVLFPTLFADYRVVETEDGIGTLETPHRKV